jgi:hypothetical protein
MATNVNSKNARSRMGASSVGKHEYGAKDDEWSSTGHVWAAGFHHVMAHSLGGHFKHINRLFL